MARWQKNYRPVSILPVLSKLLEKAVNQQLHEYLQSNNLLYNSQFRFRKNCSTKLATRYSVTRYVKA